MRQYESVDGHGTALQTILTGTVSVSVVHVDTDSPSKICERCKVKAAKQADGRRLLCVVDEDRLVGSDGVNGTLLKLKDGGPARKRWCFAGSVGTVGAGIDGVAKPTVTLLGRAGRIACISRP